MRATTRPIIHSLAIFAATILLAAAVGAEQPAAAPSSAGRPADRAAVRKIVVLYISAWNERNAERRRELVAKTWTEDGTYIDANRHGAGHAAIDAMIASAQEHFPGYRIRLVSEIESFDGNVRFSWAAGGTDEAPIYIAGTDVVTLAADGRIKTVAGFSDAAGGYVAPMVGQGRK